MSPSAEAAPTLDALLAFVDRHPRLFVLTGAGCSTDSGIPDYRDASGAWKRAPPVTYQAFTRQDSTRLRYWARSLIGFKPMKQAQPNRAHLALSSLERAGRIGSIVTQNVDGLHSAAGSRAVIDLHGRIDAIVCLDCGARSHRAAFQSRLEAANPEWLDLDAPMAPDGDADLDGVDFDRFTVPACEVCGGMLKPDVVFYGENVPAARVADAFAALESADAVLVVGSSLMVRSGYRFALAAHQRQLPIAAINRGVTRADELLSLKIDAACGPALDAVAQGYGDDAITPGEVQPRP
ncbi:NAD-dependent protein deacetylase [soil metagenome]